MADVAEGIRSLLLLRQEIERHAVEGSLLLIDLVDSTAYKTTNGEEAWLSRLIDFQDAVRRALAPLAPTKYLGDGILSFFRASETSPTSVVDVATRVLHEIQSLNISRPYRGPHLIHVRVVLGYGTVYLFYGNDPQGSPVDKLFRMEKHVPSDTVGMLEDFVAIAKPTNAIPAGQYRLRGLADGRHRLYLLSPPKATPDSALDRSRRRAALHDIWDLGLAGLGRISLISGHIPPEGGQPSAIQMGDKDAILQAYRNLALVGRLQDVDELTSLETRDRHLRENIVCIGGPCWNKVCLRLLRETRSPFIFECSDPTSDRTPIIDCLTSTVYSATWSGDRLVRDFGFFARLRNPLNRDRHIILASGIETPAVAGIVRAFSEDQNDFPGLYDALLSAAEKGDTPLPDLPDFFCLMPFDVEYTGAVHLPSIADQVRRIVFQWADGHSGRLQDPPST